MNYLKNITPAHERQALLPQINHLVSRMMFESKEIEKTQEI